MVREQAMHRSAKLNLLSIISDQNVVLFSSFLHVPHMADFLDLITLKYLLWSSSSGPLLHPPPGSRYLTLFCNTRSLRDTKYQNLALQIQHTRYIRVLHDIESTVKLMSSAFSLGPGQWFVVPITVAARAV
jgi:hypothetical protein